MPSIVNSPSRDNTNTRESQLELSSLRKGSGESTILHKKSSSSQFLASGGSED